MPLRTSGRVVLTSLAAAALVVAVMSPASTAPAAPGKPGSAPSAKVAVAAPVAVGLIVTTSRATPTTREVSAIARAVEAPATDTQQIDDNLLTVPFDQPLPAGEAVAAAVQIADLPGVESVEPNYLFTKAVASPVRPNDTFFADLVGIWDSSRYDIEPSFPAGGYSVRAPYLWRATRGSAAVRVAVIDTGFTAHPDLDANRVPGYDFAGIDEDPFNRDRDDGPEHTGWDANAADPGDFVDADTCPDGNPASTSSWHGTHVAGTIAAVDDNKRGVVGVAPNVRFQPIRVLGPCGGSLAGIATAIKWAAGVKIPEVPINKTPAKIINLSLGASEDCSAVLQDAVNLARSRGSVVIAAAGNDSSNNNTPGVSSPASCAGAIAVVALDDLGQRATYSNEGDAARRAQIAAPGGETAEGYARILSTYNRGATAPGSATYEELVGTSMAAPHVSGAAALMASLGYSRTQIEKGIAHAVQPFPQYDEDGAFNCTSSNGARTDQRDCGTGVLDLSKVPAIYKSRSVSGTMKSGRTVKTAMRGTGAKATYRWYRNGKAISGATKTSYKLTRSDRGKQIKVIAKVSRSGFRTLTAASPSRKVAR